MLKSEDLTIYIPTRNSIGTITMVLKCLRAQHLRPMIYVTDSGSFDGTQEAITRQIHSKFHDGLKVDLLLIPPPDRQRPLSICKVRHFCSQHCESRMLMFVDCDVLLPPDCLSPMLDFLDQAKTIGMLGLKYDPLSNHVKMGATMILTKLAKKLNWKIDEVCCECINAAKDLYADGFLSEHFPDQTARHMLRF